MSPTLTNRFWRDPALPGLEIRHTSYVHFGFAKHTHDAYAVGAVEDGGSYVLEPDRGLAVLQGEVMLLGPGQVHGGTPVSDHGTTYKLIYADPEWVRGLAEDLLERPARLPEFDRTVVRDPSLTRAMAALTALVARDGEADPAAGLVKGSAAVVAFSWLLARHARPAGPGRALGDEPRAVRLAQQYLADRVAEKVTLDELAAVAGLSRYHLLRVFKRSVGLPPHAWQTQLRLQRARRLLRQGLPVAQVALDTGYSDQSHFTNAFRSHMGVTPGQYQQS